MLVKRPYLWLTLAVAALYGRSLFFGFTYLDDHVLILNDLPFLSDWRNLLEVFRRDTFHTPGTGTAYYRPVFTLSLMLDAHLFGAVPAGYHLMSVAVHAAGCALLYRLLLALEFSAASSFLGALLFAVHPALAQAVCWIPARNDALFGVFAFAAFTAFARWLKDGSRIELAALLACFALALLTKETAIALPAACAGWALLEPARARGRRWTALLGAAAVVAGWWALRTAALRNPIRLDAAEVLKSLWIGKTGLLQYFGKAMLPFDLSVLPTIADTRVVFGCGAVAILLAAFAVRRPAKPRVAAFGLAWFVLFLAPTLILHSTTLADLMMEQRLYVPIAGLLVALLSWIPELAPRAGFAAAALFAVLAFSHSRHFRDRIPFWRNAARTAPNFPLAHRNLGAMLFLDGKLDEAVAEFRKAIELNPSEAMAHNNLGLVYMNQGKAMEAEVEFRRELALYPDYTDALYNLGLLYSRTGHEKEAAALWSRVLQLDPGNPDAGPALKALGAR